MSATGSLSSASLGPELAPALLGLSLPPPPRSTSGPSGHRPEDLVELARGMKLRPDAWARLAPHVAFDARQYRRVRLFRQEHWEALLLCWLPGHGTSIHDHGGSVGISLVLSGILSETRWTKVGEGQPLREAGSGHSSPPEAIVELVDTIHRVENDSGQPAISLHLYSPPLRVLGAHDVAAGTRWEIDVAGSPDVQVGGDPTW